MTIQEKKETYEIIGRYPQIDYVLIDRKTKYEPIVACWSFCDEDFTWGQGHYFSTKEDAFKYINRLIKERC